MTFALAPADALASISRDAADLRMAAAAALEAAVPSCPGWDVSDLVWHTGEVHRFWTAVVRHGITEVSQIDALYAEPERPPADELLGWFDEGAADLLVALSTADLAAPVWTWTGPRTAGWVLRRMMHETAVHRWDAESAVGSPTPIDTAVALDGIDEFLDLMYPHRLPDAAPVGGSVHLHTTDESEVHGEWLVVEGPDGDIVTREHAKGSCALRGAASDLLLVLWRRLPLSAADVVGDAAVAERFVGRARLG
jgi:uncharacterized protein (TIGR03083 family)